MGTQRFRLTYIREWRKHRKMTLERLSGLLEERGQHDLGPSALSMLERGQRAYTQQTLEALAGALGTDVQSLLTRDPSNPQDPNAIWSIWEQANPTERQLIVDIAKTITKTDT